MAEDNKNNNNFMPTTDCIRVCNALVSHFELASSPYAISCGMFKVHLVKKK